MTRNRRGRVNYTTNYRREHRRQPMPKTQVVETHEDDDEGRLYARVTDLVSVSLIMSGLIALFYFTGWDSDYDLRDVFQPMIYLAGMATFSRTVTLKPRK